MELRKYLELIGRKKWIIVLTTIVTLVVVALGTSLMTPIYQASALLRIASATGGSIDYSNYMYIERILNTYVEIVTSGPIVDELSKRLNLNISPKQISAEILPNTELLKISAEDSNPIIATQITNTLLDILIEQSNQLYSGSAKKPVEILAEQLAQAQIELDRTTNDYENLVSISLTLTPAPTLTPTPILTPAPTLVTTIGLTPTITLSSSIQLSQTSTIIPEFPLAPVITYTGRVEADIEAARQKMILKQETYARLLSEYEEARTLETIRANMLSVVEPAVTPETPSKPRVGLNLALGTLVGLIGGIALAFLLENLDTTLYSTEEIEAITGLPTFIGIPKFSKKQLYVSNAGSSIKIDMFRNFRTKIQLLHSHRSIKFILLVSAEPNQGKSMIAANLAFYLAEAGNKALAIDCDLRLPKLHKYIALPNRTGLSDVLEGKIKLEKAIQKSIYDGFYVLTSGSRPDDPSLLLASQKMEELVEAIGQEYDFVLIDTPALLATADVSLLTRFADGVILVVRRGYAKREAVELAAKFLEGFPEKSLGVVVNFSEPSGHYYHYQKRG